MGIVDYILFALAWSLIPIVLLLKAHMDREQALSEKECWDTVDRILKTEKRQ